MTDTAPATAQRLTNNTKVNETLTLLLNTHWSPPDTKIRRINERDISKGEAKGKGWGEEMKKREMEKRRREKWKERKKTRDRKVGRKGFVVKGERKRGFERKSRKVDWRDCQIKKLKKRCLMMVVWNPPPPPPPSLSLNRVRSMAAEMDIVGSCKWSSAGGKIGGEGFGFGGLGISTLI
ncbi:UNVERIFIED_CONTAM: hypothetical protein Sindi_0502500 [Sesamum indicum]